MAEQVIVSVYRTAEQGDSYRSAYTISFFHTRASVQALSGTYTRACQRELELYLRSRGIARYEYLRKKRGQIIHFERDIP